MRRTLDSRPLLLEQLEARTMLAGGSFAQTGGDGRWDFARDRSAEHHDTRSDIRTNDSRTQSRLDQRLAFEPFAPANRHERLQSRVESIPIRLDFQTMPMVAPSVVVDSSTRLQADNDLSGRTIVVIDVQRPPSNGSNSLSLLSDESDSPVNTPRRESDSTQTTIKSPDIDSTDVGANSPNLVNQAKPTASNQNADPLIDIGQTGMEAASTPSSDTSLVETPPASQSSTFIPQATRRERYWELDSDTLLRLRALSQEESFRSELPKPKSQSERHSTKGALHETRPQPGEVDSVITCWFGDNGGLIELQQEDAMPFPISTLSTSEIVNVVLKATLGLNQRLELIASDSIQSPAANARAQVLAAIADEMSWTAEPIHPIPIQISTVTYSAAAAVAGIFAAVGRKRRHSVVLARTSAEPPFDNEPA